MVGAAKPKSDAADAGMENERVAVHLSEAAGRLAAAKLSGLVAQTVTELAERLAVLAQETREQGSNLEELERTLTALEDKLMNALLATATEEELTTLREQSAQELAPYRRRMQALQIRQIEQQFLHKRMLEKYDLPRLSLFYMRQD
jgi:hypothetical protein